MEFTVSKSDLVRELSLSQGVVEKKTTIPILSNVLLEAAGDRLTLTATDLELGIRCSCPARVKKEGSGTVPARKLLDYVRLLPEGDVNMKFLENHWASITSGRSRTRIAGMSRESFPELPQMPEPIAEIPVKTLASMIARTSFAISMEESRFTLNGALLLMRPEGLTMVATDGHRLAYVQASPAESGTADKPFRALIPKKAMNELTKLSDDAGDRCQGDRCRRRQSPVLPGWPPPADHAQTDRQFSRTTNASCPRITSSSPSSKRPKSARPSNAWRSLPTSVRAPSGCSSLPAKCVSSLPAWKPARAKRAFRASTTGPISRSVSTLNTCWISCARFRRIRWRSS